MMTSDDITARSKPQGVGPTFVDGSAVPDRRGSVSVMSQQIRNGQWVMPREFRAVTVMGNIELDLTQALIGPGTSKVEVVAIMSQITVIVPPGVRIECDGDPFMGSFEIHRYAESTAGPDSPLIEVSGTAIMSSINAFVVDPNDPDWRDNKLQRWIKKKKKTG
jgi:hypothetical protein